MWEDIAGLAQWNICESCFVVPEGAKEKDGLAEIVASELMALETAEVATDPGEDRGFGWHLEKER